MTLIVYLHSMSHVYYIETYIKCAYSGFLSSNVPHLNCPTLTFLPTQPLSLDDQLEMARERVGLASWEELSVAEQDKLLEKKIWRKDVYQAW